MGMESDSKSELVLEICSLSTSSVSCAHRNPCGNSSHVKSHFVDWYRILGVEEDVDIDGIRKQYHKLALQLHPDKNKHPKAEIAFKLVLEAYSCLSDTVKRRAFNLERWKNFCIECNRIPYASRNSLGNPCRSRLKENSANYTASHGVLQGLRNIRDRFKEEARVMENCLRANANLRKESPVFSPSEQTIQSATRGMPWKESPIFNPSDYVSDGYPHIRNRIYKKPDEFWCFQRNSILNNSPIFDNKSDRDMFKSRSTYVYS